MVLSNNTIIFLFVEMSVEAAKDDENNLSTCCASCGIAEIDDIKLKDCDGCDLVKYCSDKCKEDHRPQHEEACTDRAAELRDELLFKQPESSRGTVRFVVCRYPLMKQNQLTCHVVARGPVTAAMLPSNSESPRGVIQNVHFVDIQHQNWMKNWKVF